MVAVVTVAVTVVAAVRWQQCGGSRKAAVKAVVVAVVVVVVAAEVAAVMVAEVVAVAVVIFQLTTAMILHSNSPLP